MLATALKQNDDWAVLVALFDDLFFDSENTRLVSGVDEPIYLPNDEQFSYNRIIFAHGFFASALHELSHWCVAGVRRRKLVDYGYWYEPDGRTANQQAEFEKVEIKPQALEWIFSVACGRSFSVSVDNLSGEETDSSPFKQAVFDQVCHYIDKGLPSRAEQLCLKLSQYFQTGNVLQKEFFILGTLK